MKELREESSLLYWFPKIKDLPIPIPKTVIWLIPKKYFPDIWFEESVVFKMIEENEKEILKNARKIGFPLFLRTDQASAKFSWERSCYVEREEDLKRHAFEVIDFNLYCDILHSLPFKALVFREFIQGEIYFKAFFGNLPIGKEVRVFIRDGKVLCHHYYWIKDAIRETRFKPKNWEELLDKASKLSEEDIKTIYKYSELVAERFENYWSIDFMKSKDGKWYLIDMARGEISWHPPCKYKLTKDIRGA